MATMQPAAPSSFLGTYAELAAVFGTYAAAAAARATYGDGGQVHLYAQMRGA